MRWLIWIFAVLTMQACRPAKETATPVVITTSDSTRIETRYRETIIHDTVTVRIPEQTARRETRDSVSWLENDYAISMAGITGDGILMHTLETKPGEIPVPIEGRNTEIEKIVYRDRSVEVPVPYPVLTEKELSRWQRFCIGGFWIMAAAWLAIIGWRYRRQIIRLVRKII